MRYLVFSDVHGNVEALEGALAETDNLRPDIIVSLGDVVGYGANPNECIDVVQDCTHLRIGGNHDLAAAGIIDTEDFNRTAKQAIMWTSNMLDDEHRNILSGYDPVRHHGPCIFAHASPVCPLEWEYIYTLKQAGRIFEQVTEKFIFIGHTHIPGIITWERQNGCNVMQSSLVQIKPECRYLINVGSIGQPRDGIAAASFALLDVKKQRIFIRRIPYDIRQAQEKIRSVGLPESLASRLATAR